MTASGSTLTVIASYGSRVTTEYMMSVSDSMPCVRSRDRDHLPRDPPLRSLGMHRGQLLKRNPPRDLDRQARLPPLRRARPRWCGVARLRARIVFIARRGPAAAMPSLSSVPVGFRLRSGDGEYMIAQVLMGAGAVALATYGIVAGVRSSREIAKRRSTPVEWDPRFPRDAFLDFVLGTAQELPRVHASSVDGLIVNISVRSNSGLTTWKAEVDFCDYGRLTGKYWISSENTQSPIPQALADAVVAEVDGRLGTQASAS